ncbi:MAG: DUF488 domain-containing protein [Candidatus Bathyarchaeota archaeon]|nr:DUF488 domain-containing protein [Candidatus Bathyarchaeota archaeon]
MRIYTIGYGGRNIEEFIGALRKCGVTMIIDVRRFPRSRDPSFSGEQLKRVLGENGIKYVFLGETLGGFVKGGYEKYMETQSFREGIEKLLSVIREEVAALMCKERNVKYCHRRFISGYLESLGIEVIHV